MALSKPPAVTFCGRLINPSIKWIDKRWHIADERTLQWHFNNYMWESVTSYWMALRAEINKTSTTSSIWHQTIRTSGALCFNWINIIKFFPNITSQGISSIDSEEFLQQWQSNLAKILNTGLSQQWLYRFYMSPGSVRWPIVMVWRPSSSFVRLHLLLKKYWVNLYQIWTLAV